MTKPEAAAIVAYLTAAFPTASLEEESVAVLVDEISLLHDPYTGTEAAQIIVRRGDKFPSISEFRKAYRGVHERNTSSSGLPPADSQQEMPEWVMVWWWARKLKSEGRVFPQQYFSNMRDGERRELDLFAVKWGELTPPQYEELREAWTMEGGPRPTSVNQLMGAVK